MSNPRKSLAELRAEGSPNVLRSVRREIDEQSAPPLDAETKSEIAQLDVLIQKVMKACAHGSTFRKKANPAFAQLHLLIRARDLLLRGKARPAKLADAQEEVNEFLAAAGIN
jgi:hypothetical protein